MQRDEYTSIDLSRRAEYERAWEATPSRSIDYSLANLWGWAGHFGLKWRFAEGLCWIRQEYPSPCRWAPLGPWDSADWENMPGLSEDPEFVRVPQALADLLGRRLPGRIRAEEEREHWEYLYNAGDMATLPGNRFHRKRNHVNAYVKAYGEPDYRLLDESVIEDILMLAEEWCRWHECADSPALAAENEAVNHVLTHWKAFSSLLGGALYAEDRIVAFAVGEILDSDAVGVHFEKGRHGYRGVYQMVNACFARRHGEGMRFINRAQDLGEEGLRQAKLSYLPVDFLRKYRVRIMPG
jgi:hypothetical protein